MGYRIVRISGELWADMFSEGYTLPTKDGYRLRVVKGLPEGAKLVDVHKDIDAFCSNSFLLKFEHPSWPDLLPGERIPEILPEFMMERIGDSADTPHVVEGGQ